MNKKSARELTAIFYIDIPFPHCPDTGILLASFDLMSCMHQAAADDRITVR